MSTHQISSILKSDFECAIIKSFRILSDHLRKINIASYPITIVVNTSDSTLNEGHSLGIFIPSKTSSQIFDGYRRDYKA